MKKAFTLIELLLSIGLILLLLGAVILLINPGQQVKKARDNKILSTMTKFEQEILEAKLDTGSFPDSTPPLGVTYVHLNSAYELNATLEYHIIKAQTDGGNNPAVYELGNDLTLL